MIPVPIAPRTGRRGDPGLGGSSPPGRLDDAMAMGREDGVRVDHRSTVSFPATRGRDELRAAAAGGDRRRVHGPCRRTTRRPGRAILPRPIYDDDRRRRRVRLSDRRRVRRGRTVVLQRVHDEDDRDAAEDDLDERYLAGEGAGCAEVFGASVRLRRAHCARDWEALRDGFDPGVVFRDHRRLGWAAGDRDELTRMFREGVELVPDMRLRFRSHHIVGDASFVPTSRSDRHPTAASSNGRCTR